MKSTKDRAFQALSLSVYNAENVLGDVGEFELSCPHDTQYVLRMIVKLAHESLKLPPELEWLRYLIEASDEQQRKIGISQPFCYVTVRSGPVISENDDVWHVDGFSTKVTHLPEQNYIISDCYPTEYVERGFDFPADFDPLIYNVHAFFQSRITEEDHKVGAPYRMYCLDPYIPHKRQVIPDGVSRTFVRISYTPIEIMDDANTENPLIPMRKYNRDGVKIRDELKTYNK